MSLEEFSLHLLQSQDQIQLLNDIDNLRSDGVQHHDISLPQLVVCGDKSSGKSSVLEAISKVKFPVDSGTCTRFAMELALRRSPDKKASAKITPGRDASPEHKERIAAFKPSETCLSGVPRLIEEAKATIGVGGGDAVCDDVLRLEINGPDLPHLTLVDLPGHRRLSGFKRHQEDRESCKIIHEEREEHYLAIMSAGNDRQLQKVLRLAREYDPQGDRTVGIITKPDTLDKERESTKERDYVDLAKKPQRCVKTAAWLACHKKSQLQREKGSYV